MGKLHIVMYHYTRDLRHSRYPKIKGLDLELFKEQIQWFTRGGQFVPVTMEQVLAAVEEKYTLPENALLLTFDDGYIDNYLYAMPVLQEFGVQGSFFIPGKTFSTHQLLDVNKIHYVLASAEENSRLPELLKDVFSKMQEYRSKEFNYPDNKALYDKYASASRFDSAEIVFIKQMLQTVLPEAVRNKISSDLFEKYVGVSEKQLAYELYMNADQIRTMKRNGMYIGIHGYDHYWLGNLPREQMEADIDKALEVMDEFIDADAWVMNYPYGNYNAGVLEYIKSKGCRLGLTTEVRVADIGNDSILEFPRLDCNDFPPKSENYIRF